MTHGIKKNRKVQPGIQCPTCGCCEWHGHKVTRSPGKIVRVKVCQGCGQRIRTNEVFSSKHPPKMYARDPETRCKVPATV